MRRLTVAELIAGGHELAAPFELELQIAGRRVLLECSEVLRWLPGRRLVTKVTIPADEQSSQSHSQSQTLVLKLFVGKSARRYRQREAQGLEWLRDAGQRTPAQSAEIVVGGRAEGLLFDYLADAEPVAASDRCAFAQLVRHFAVLHDQGIWHEDAKLDNFLSAAEQIWFVDGDAIRRQGSPLDTQAALENLALLLAQRPPRFDDQLESLVAEYCRTRGWPADASHVRSFERALRHARHRRLDRYLRKTLRECSEFATLESSDFSGVRVRELQEEIWQPLLADPNAVMAQAEPVKAGNSATVVRWRPPTGGSLIVKRYNVKSPVHAWRRTLRPVPRYRRAWQFGHGLKLFDIATARPLLLLERQGRWPRGEAWLVMEDLGDSVLNPAEINSGCPLDSLVEIFHALRRLGIEHGDTKASNFLLHNGRWHLIDLDAMRRTKHGWQQDVARFEDNFTAEIPAPLQSLRLPLV